MHPGIREYVFWRNFRQKNGGQKYDERKIVERKMEEGGEPEYELSDLKSEIPFSFRPSSFLWFSVRPSFCPFIFLSKARRRYQRFVFRPCQFAPIGAASDCR